MKEKSFIKNAITVSVGGTVSKILGALYRIPLLYLLGAYGMGLYHVVFPVYALIYTATSSGIALAVSKRISEAKLKSNAIIKSSVKVYTVQSVIFTVISFVSAFTFSGRSGMGVLSYLFTLPAVALAPFISVYRGYFQGIGEMKYSAVSEITETLTKIIFGVVFAFIFRSDVKRAVEFLLLSVSLSETVCFLYLFVSYSRKNKKSYSSENYPKKAIIRLSIPVAVSSLITPLVVLVESIIIVKSLSYLGNTATRYYGLYTGGATLFISLAQTLCTGVSTATVPHLSEVKNDITAIKNRTKFSALITLIISATCFIGFYLFSPIAVSIIFRSLSDADKTVLIKLIKTLSYGVIFLCVSQTLSACLTAQGKPFYGFISATTSGAVRIFCDLLFIKSGYGIYGACLSADVSYFVAFSMNLLYNFLITQRSVSDYDNGSKFGREFGRFNGKRKASNSFGK